MNAIDANGVRKEIGTLVLSNIHKLSDHATARRPVAGRPWIP